MNVRLANKFLALGLVLYLIAGVSALLKFNFNLIVILAAIVFIAFGFFAHMKLKWVKLFKKKAQ